MPSEETIYRHTGICAVRSRSKTRRARGYSVSGIQVHDRPRHPKSARLSENGAKGGRGNKAAESKQKQNKSNESKEKPNIRHKTEEKDKEIIIPHYVRDYCAEPQATHAPPAVELPLNDGDIYPVTQEQVAEWGSLYPAVDVMQQLRAMKGWLNANPAKRKTRRGILRFVNAWLSREQDRGRGAPAKPAEPVRKYNHDTGKWEIVEG